ncbi:hypothetical protein JFZ81_002271, partial [Salmonella enterica]|nr:hypothetical protein [Salmonella enterica]
RPLLASEFSATPGKTLTIANGYYDKGETWGMITVDKAWNGTGGGCGRDTLTMRIHWGPELLPTTACFRSARAS